MADKPEAFAKVFRPRVRNLPGEAEPVTAEEAEPPS